MVWVPNGPDAGWYEPPYTDEEEMMIYRHGNGPMTIYRSRPEPPEPETDPELEKTIADLIEQKNTAPEGSAAYRLAVRELAGLRYSRELAGPIMEDLDPYEWGAMCTNPDVPDPEGQVLPLRPRRRT
jgi:hypothetical protein